MNVRDQVARIIDRHEWSRLDGGSNGQQIADDLAAKGLLHTAEEPVAMHQVKPGDVILITHADVVPQVVVVHLYEIVEPVELGDGDITLRGHRTGADPSHTGRILTGPANMILRKLVD
jgi:hypothetical protein